MLFVHQILRIICAEAPYIHESMSIAILRESADCFREFWNLFEFLGNILRQTFTYMFKQTYTLISQEVRLKSSSYLLRTL